MCHGKNLLTQHQLIMQISTQSLINVSICIKRRVWGGVHAQSLSHLTLYDIRTVAYQGQWDPQARKLKHVKYHV